MTQEIEDLKRLSDEERKELIRLEVVASSGWSFILGVPILLQAMRDGSAYEQEQYVNEKGELMRRLESLKEQNKKSCLPCINHSVVVVDW